MPSVQQLIDDQIRKLQALKELVSDPTMAPFLKRAVLESGEIPGDEPVSSPTASDDRSRPLENQSVSHRNSVKGVHTGLTEEVRKAVDMQTGRFHHNDILATIRMMGFELKAANPAVAVSAVLRRFLESGEIVKDGETATGAFLYRKSERGDSLQNPL